MIKVKKAKKDSKKSTKKVAKKAVKLVAKKRVSRVTNSPVRRVAKRAKPKSKKRTLLALFATLFFGALAFIAWKKRYNRLSIVFGLFSLLNAGFFVFNIDVLAPFVKIVPLFTLLLSCLSGVLFSAINLVSPGTAKKITKLLNL